MTGVFLEQYIALHEWLTGELPDEPQARGGLNRIDDHRMQGKSEPEIAEIVLKSWFRDYGFYPTLTAMPPDAPPAKLYHCLADGREHYAKQYAALHTTAHACYFGDEDQECCIQ